MKSRGVDTVYLLGGALLGATAMYLFDPAVGDRRRQALAKAADHAYEEARHAAEHQWDRLASNASDAYDAARGVAGQVADRASHLGHDVSGYTHDLAGQASDIASDLSDRASRQFRYGKKIANQYSAEAGDWGHRLMSSARQLGDRLTHWGAARADEAQDAANRLGRWGSTAADRAQASANRAIQQAKYQGRYAAHRARKNAQQATSWFHDQTHPSHGLGAPVYISSTAVLAALGAGAYYFYGTDQGAQRRQWVANEVSDCVQNTGRMMRKFGQEIGNRVSSLFNHGREAAQDIAQRARVDSEELIRRVREKVRQYIPDANQVQFMADGDGTVTVTGIIVPDKVQSLLSLLHDIPGVRHVINRIEIREPAQKSF